MDYTLTVIPCGFYHLHEAGICLGMLGGVINKSSGVPYLSNITVTTAARVYGRNCRQSPAFRCARHGPKFNNILFCCYLIKQPKPSMSCSRILRDPLPSRQALGRKPGENDVRYPPSTNQELVTVVRPYTRGWRNVEIAPTLTIFHSTLGRTPPTLPP